LGDNLLGLQAGNEPDLYMRHGHRPATYNEQSYIAEVDSLLNAMSGDAHTRNRDILIGPNIATGDWTPQMMIDSGFIQRFAPHLMSLAVEQSVLHVNMPRVLNLTRPVPLQLSD
jgi:hypothetical protein